jgi:putative DNA primase/helicase
MGDLSKLLDGPWEASEPDPPEMQLRLAMTSLDLYPPSLELDGKMHRFPIGTSRDAGWYVAYGDGVPAGVFGNWKTGEQQSWRADVGHELTIAEQMTHSRRMAELSDKREAERKGNNEIAADVCGKIWTRAGLASDDHPYLKRKSVKAHGLRITGDGRLIAPLYGEEGELRTVQYIDHDGEKKYHSKGGTKRLFNVLGDIENECFIAEGYATGATIYEVTGKPVIIAYSAFNIVNVAEIFRNKYPTLSMTIVADLDDSGTGQSYADQAAAKYGCRVIVSPVDSDVNDFVQAGGDLLSLLEGGKDIIERLQVFTGDSIEESEYDPPDEIVEDLLTSSTLNMLYGASHSGKTFFAIALAVAVSNGDMFFDKHTDKGNVVYLATEAPRTVRDRLHAIKRYQGKSLDNFYVVPLPLNFYSNRNDVIDVINLCNKIGNVKLVIGDTLARMSAGANENSGEDMGPIMESFDSVARETGSSVLIIHHSGKNAERGSRGWSGMPAHIDAEIEITPAGERGEKTARVSKQRELGTTGMEIPFKLKVVEMGEGKFGSMKTSCIVKEDEEPREKKKPLKSETFFRYFEDAWLKLGCETSRGLPYVSYSGIKEKMTNDKYAPSDRTIKNHLMPSYETKMIGVLMNERIIEPEQNGWVVIDSIKSSIMMMSRVVPLGPQGPCQGPGTKTV